MTLDFVRVGKHAMNLRSIADAHWEGGIRDSAHAIKYVTKYLTKMPDAFPLWVLERKEKGIRFIGGCKALGSLTGAASRGSESEEEERQLELFREPRNRRPATPVRQNSIRP